jgi:hypothetical protein
MLTAAGVFLQFTHKEQFTIEYYKVVRYSQIHRSIKEEILYFRAQGVNMLKHNSSLPIRGDCDQLRAERI